MKRLIVCLLCVCLLLPMVFAVTAAAAGNGATEALFVATDKAVYLPGEPIKITATPADDQLDWVGIVPADAQGNPLTKYGSIYWEPIYAVGDKSVQEYSHPIGTAKGNELATELGITRAQLLDLPAGRYFAVRVPDDLGVHTAAQQGLALFTPFTIANKISVEKTSFLYGEDIPVTALTGGGTDWIGISPVADDGTVARSTRYIYIAPGKGGAGTNVAVNIREGVVNGTDAEPIKDLPVGRYVLYFVANNGGFANRDKSTEIYINVVGATVEKTEFKYGEPIMVTGYGRGTDWIGISKLDESTETGYWKNTSIRWRYIVHEHSDPKKTGYGYGVAFDIREATNPEAGVPLGDLPIGEYVIYVGLDDCYVKDVSPYTQIKITVVGFAPDAPTSAQYALDDSSTGLAGGKLTVSFADEAMELGKQPSKLTLYWGDAEGNMLSGSREIGSYNVAGTVTEITLPSSLTIPVEAKKLMVRADNACGSSDAIAASLPADRGYRSTGAKIASFQVVSDIHIGNGNYSNEHASALFADILAIDPDSLGIFVAGDTANSGKASEFEAFYALWEASGLSAKPYLAVGNHEMYVNGNQYVQAQYNAQIGQFISFKNTMLESAEQTDKAYYYIERGGQHFIFLATEYCGTHAYLSDAQLAWLEATLADVAADGAPVFIMIHQGLYDTIAGTLEGQGWSGIIAGDANFAAWQELTAANNVSTSNHSLMKGQYEQPLRDILAEYPSAMMFSGHSHWVMASQSNICEATEAQPNYFFNTASISYLWTDDGEMNGGHGTAEGSEGYYVTVYENCIEVRGRDFFNGEWITGASYQVWLACAHEYEHECSTVCRLCGESRSDVTHNTAMPCTDTVCTVCGEALTPVSHTGEHACSTTCQYGCGTAVTASAQHTVVTPCTDTACTVCGAAVTPVPHTGEHACSTVCKYGCGTAVTASVQHTVAKPCTDTACAVCGETVTTVAHAGEHACSNICQWCNGAAVPTADHTVSTPCTDTACAVCGAAVTPALHEGSAACATVCKYGCGTAVTPTAEHTAKCTDPVCSECGEAVANVGGHDGAACATVCKYGCGTALTPTAAHTVVDPCTDTVCAVCGEAVTPVSHEGEYACSATCKYGCGTVITPAAQHTTDYACDACCKVCGEEVAHSAHEGVKACATVCKHGCGTLLTPEAAHKSLHDCAEVCMVCGESKTPESAHVIHVACRDTVCEECGAAVTPVPHAGKYACSTVCQYGCGGAIEPISEHDYGEWEIKTPATATANGVRQHTCGACGKVEKQSIEATGTTTDPDADHKGDDAPAEKQENDPLVLIIIVVCATALVVGGSVVFVVKSKKKVKKKDGEN